MEPKVSVEQKGKLIAAIISHLKFEYRNKLTQRSFTGKQADLMPFDEGDTFFSLAFRTEAELRKIASLMGI